MNGTPTRVKSIRDRLGDAQDCAGRFLHGAKTSVSLGDLLTGDNLWGGREKLAGRSVLVLTGDDQLTAALAIIQLDGIASRLILAPPDLSSEHVAEIVKKAQVEVVISGRDSSSTLSPAEKVRGSCSTEWVLMTSGTSGPPKMASHTLESLTGAMKSQAHRESDVVWGTFYDIRRYGGLQILLRGLLGRGSFVLSSATESPADHLLRLAAHSVTHLTGTPSHWRRAVMSPAAREISPRYVRLSGEIADQSILNTLRSFYPQAAIGHAYASTEAGVGFEVNDGLEGFPASVVGKSGDVEVKVQDGALHVRSSRTASGYVGEETQPLRDAAGFVDTGDMVELRGNRYYFRGRRSGVINVGGLKVHPEEVEASLNGHPAVRMSCVRSHRNPITGSLVVADIVLKLESTPADTAQLKREILQYCNERLPRHMVPVILNFVPALKVSATGKVARPSYA